MENLIKSELSFCDEVVSRQITESQRKIFSNETIAERRRRISSQVFEQLNGVVQFGPFQGMQLSSNPHWGSSDRASMLLGLYEKEVLDYIMSLPLNKDRNFIDIGAADGYYAIGFLMAERFKQSICFELTELGQQVIAENAERNGVGHKVKIHGVANDAALESFSEADLEQAVVLVDIEGAEFEVLSQRNLEKLRNSYLVIEIHNWIDGFKEKYNRLLNDANEIFNLSVLKVGQREIPELEIFENFPDDNRWLMLSEGRPNRMRWLCCTPKSASV